MPNRPVTFFALLSAVAVAVYTVLWCVDFGRIEQLPPALWGRASAAEALQQLAQVTVGLLGVVVTVVSIIVELASNRYTPRITEVFLRDRVNLLALSGFVVTTVLSVWVALSAADQVPYAMMLTTVVAVSVSLLALLPYFAYVFEFLSPADLVGRLAAEACADLAPPRVAGRARVVQRIDQLGDVALKSVQNQDKTIAIAACQALHTVASAHIRAKADAEPAWFDVAEALKEDADFVAFHGEVLRETIARRTWLDLKVLLQLQGALREALNDVQDLAHFVGILTRRLGVEAASMGDADAVQLCVRSLNTSLRAAIHADDVRTVYNLLSEYRLFAVGLLGTRCQHELLPLAGHMKLYGQLAFRARLAFILETAAYDIAVLIEEVGAAGAPEHDALLRILLDVDREPDGGTVQEAGLLGVRKAQVKLATWYLERGQEELARRIHADMCGEDPHRLATIRAELERTTDRAWSEISDRGVNFDWLPEPRRAWLPVFFGWFASTPPVASGAAPR